MLTRSVRADVGANVIGHRASGLPGDTTSGRLLRMALNRLILERLTLPEVYSAQEADELVAHAVDRLV